MDSYVEVYTIFTHRQYHKNLIPFFHWYLHFIWNFYHSDSGQNKKVKGTYCMKTLDVTRPYNKTNDGSRGKVVWTNFVTDT